MTAGSGTLLHRRRLLTATAALAGCLVAALFLFTRADRGPGPNEATQVHTGATGPIAPVPDFVGDTQSEAQQLLSKAGYWVEVVPIARGTVPGTVVNESPSAGSLLPLGTKVVLELTASSQ